MSIAEPQTPGEGERWHGDFSLQATLFKRYHFSSISSLTLFSHTRIYTRVYECILRAGYMTGPFDVRQVERFLQEMGSRMGQMRQAADEEKVCATKYSGGHSKDCLFSHLVFPTHL